MTVATLGLAVNSGQVTQATPELQKLTAAAGQAEAAATRLAGATNVEAAAQGKATAASRMHTAALQAEAAAMRMSSQVRTNMIFQLNDVAVSLASGMNPALVAMQQGSQILQFGLGPALKSIGDLAVGIGTKFAPLLAVVGGLSILLKGLTDEINAVSGANVSMGDVALAVFQSMADGIQSTLGPAYDWLVTEFNNAVLQISADTAREINFIIGAFAGSVEAIKATWSVLPDALGFVIYDAAQKTVNGVIYMVREVQVHLNDVLTDVNSLMAKAGMAPLSLMNLSAYVPTENPYAGAGSAVGAAGDAFNSAMGKDYVGDWMQDIGSRAQDIARARKEAEDLGKAASAANDNFGKLVDQGLGDLTHWTESFGKAAQSAFSNLGSGIVDAFKKGGDIASNVLNMLMDKVGQFGETLLNNGLNGLLNAGLGALGGMFGGGTWGVAGGFSGFSGIFGIPGMATGGTVGREGLSWVGEQGPELLRLPAGAQVIPNGPSLAANQNGAPQFNITNYMQVMPGAAEEDGAAFARGVTRELRKQLPDAIQSYNRNPLRRAS